MERKVELIDSFLEFYTNKSISFASFLVGSMFGLFTLLSLLRNTIQFPKSFLLLTISYVIMVGFGVYCMLKWGYYAMLASKTKEQVNLMIRDPLYRPYLFIESFTKWLSGIFHPIKSRLWKIYIFEGVYLIVSIVSYWAIWIL